MASPDPRMRSVGNWPGRVVAYREFAMDLVARREGLGEVEVPRNAGNRRTASKQALLKALDQLGTKW